MKVITIPILPMTMLNAFLLASPKGHVLVDAGIDGSERRIAKTLGKHGVDMQDVNLIVITHAHGDHAGGASELRKRCNAPVLAHEAELPYYLQEKPMAYCPTGWVGRLLKKSGRLEKGYDAFRPDILLSGTDTFDLSEYGLTGTVRPTPGHTEGSLSVTLSDRAVLAGDLVTSGILLGGIVRKGIAKSPPFEQSAAEVNGELTKLLDQGFETFYLGHGGPLSSKQIRRYLERRALPAAA